MLLGRIIHEYRIATGSSILSRPERFVFDMVILFLFTLFILGICFGTAHSFERVFGSAKSVSNTITKGSVPSA